MIGIYCRGVHGTKRGELCEACRQLQAYADLRTEKCPFMETKTFCSACKVHCYSKEMQEKICEVMKYADQGCCLCIRCLPSGMCILHFGIRKSRKRSVQREKGEKHVS